VKLLLSFDEAHCLHDIGTVHTDGRKGKNVTKDRPFGYAQRTGYYAFVSALDELKGLGIFTIFMSTSSNLAQFAPQKGHWLSSRSTDRKWDLNDPFTELPFDVFAKDESLITENTSTLEEICQIRFMLRYGRPL